MRLVTKLAKATAATIAADIDGRGSNAPMACCSTPRIAIAAVPTATPRAPVRTTPRLVATCHQATNLSGGVVS